MDVDRRKFLRESFSGTVAMAAAPMFVPGKAWGANDRLSFGLIGAGLRGRYLSQVCQAAGARCAAVCDVYEPNLQLALKDSPEAKPYVEYRDLLAQKGLDFVVIATPDHQHCPNLLDALAAGYDVYLEKPMSHSLEESGKMVQAVRKSRKIVQIGMQRRSAGLTLKAKEVVDDGALGKITLARTQWKWNAAGPLDNSPLRGKLDWKRFLGPAPKRPFEPMCFRVWRSFWDYSGGNLTDQGTHLMDVIQWFTKSGTPSSATCTGRVAKMIGAEAPDVFCAVFDYPDCIATFTLNYCNDYQDHWSVEFQGDKGTLIIDDRSFTVYREPWKDHREPVSRLDLRLESESHVRNFLDCVKSRQEPNAPVEVGASAVTAVHLANIAYRSGRVAKLSSDGTRAS